MVDSGADHRHESITPTGCWEPVTLSWSQALARRMRQHFLDPVGTESVAGVVGRLGAVQAQVAGAAELALRLRRRRSRPGDVDRALAQGRIIKSWAFRGAFHLVDRPARSALDPREVHQDVSSIVAASRPRCLTIAAWRASVQRCGYCPASGSDRSMVNAGLATPSGTAQLQSSSFVAAQPSRPRPWPTRSPSSSSLARTP